MAKYIIGDIFKGDYPISQYYGNNHDYYSQFGFNGHEGVDWATPVGIEILAPFNRNVILQDQDVKSGAYGNYIVVWDPEQKCAIWYCHLDLNSVSIGKEYPRGTVLGKTGNSGNTTGPHIHVNFVETDASGARLNTNNGFKGMLNILDGNLVEWKLGTQPQPAPSQPAGTITIPQTTFEELVNKATKYDEFKGAGYENIDKVKTEIKAKQDTIDNLNQQINDRNNDITQLNGKVSTLDAQVLSLTQKADSLETQAKLVPQLTAERDELVLQKELWINKEKAFTSTVQGLNKEIKELKDNAFSAFLKSILDRFF